MYHDFVLSLVHEADRDTCFFDGGVEDTPAEIDPGLHVIDVGRDFAAENTLQDRQREKQERDGKEIRA